MCLNTKTYTTLVVYTCVNLWATLEAELFHRYKDITDTIREGKLKGIHSPEYDIFMHKKANAIINCYIDSAVPPKVQV